MPGANVKKALMWACEECGRESRASRQVCWNCGSERTKNSRITSFMLLRTSAAQQGSPEKSPSQNKLDTLSARPISDEKYKTFWRRFWAGMVDGLVFLPLGFVTIWISQDYTSIPGLIMALWYIFDTFALVTYSVLMHGSYGQTLGKMLTGVKVLDVSGGKLSLRQAVVRDIVPIVGAVIALPYGIYGALLGRNPYTAEFQSLGCTSVLLFLGWGAAELVTMLMNRKRRAIHDFLADSVVVRLPKP